LFVSNIATYWSRKSSGHDRLVVRNRSYDLTVNVSYMPLKVTSEPPEFDANTWDPMMGGDYSKRIKQGIFRSICAQVLAAPEATTNWNVVAPSGQYVANIEQVHARLNKVEKFEIGKLSAIVSQWRETVDQAIRLSEIHALVQRPGAAPREVVPLTSVFEVGEQNFGIQTQRTQQFINFVVSDFRVEESYGSAVDYSLRFLYYELQLFKAVLKTKTITLLRTRFSRLARDGRKLVRQAERAFCGTTWSKRVWHLLHGSHPPKSDGLATLSQAFGCA
jgi:hypothetical protein